VRLPGATHPNSVWCYDSVHDRFADGRAFRVLCVLDEHTRECLALEVARSITSQVWFARGSCAFMGSPHTSALIKEQSSPLER